MVPSYWIFKVLFKYHYTDFLLNVNLESVTIRKEYLLIKGGGRVNTFQLSCFLAVAEYLSFAQAAQQLHVTHPAVSQQIQSLLPPGYTNLTTGMP